MTFGQVIKSIHFCKVLNPWLIIGLAGCIMIAWLWSKGDSKWLPVKYILFAIAFGMTVKGVWNINFSIALGVLGTEIILLVASIMVSQLL